MNKDFFSSTELAKLLGVSRITVFNNIQSGKIKAEKIGRNYAIRKQDVLQALGSVLGEDKKREIEKAVTRATKEYGETFRLLGKE